MHTTYFDEYRSSSGVSKIVGETAVLLFKVKFFGYALAYAFMCSVVVGSSSYCVVCSCYEFMYMGPRGIVVS
jgi:hypothetical protein